MKSLKIYQIRLKSIRSLMVTWFFETCIKLTKYYKKLYFLFVFKLTRNILEKGQDR